MKIGIITLYGNKNFGNRLQNYAVQRYFESLGYQTETFGYREYFSAARTIRHYIAKLVHFFSKSTKYGKEKLDVKQINHAREVTVAEFTSEYIHGGPYIKGYRFPKNIKSNYNYFVTGSDQVWHCWGGSNRELDFFFLRFANQSQRLTIAPSFGFEEFPARHLSTFKKGLKGFKNLSVREERGAELIKELTGKEATVLLDPTMLIDTEEWWKILKKPVQYTDKDYILVYMLSGFKEEFRNIVCNYAEKTGNQVIDLMDIHSDYYVHTRPDEFLYWVCHARLVVTDSFHACVFSILFNRPFIVAERKDKEEMSGRIDTLLDRFGMGVCRYETLQNTFSDSLFSDDVIKFDYEKTDSILKLEREKAKDFFQNCMNKKHRI